MRLLLVSSEFPPGPGGIGTHAYQLACGLHRRGWEVEAAAPQDYAEDADIRAFGAAQPFRVVRYRPVPVPPIEAAYRLTVTSGLIRRRRPDVMVASGERSAWLTALLSRWYRIPWVAVGHGSEFGLRAGWERRLTRWSFEQASAVVTVSEFTRRRMHAMGIRPKQEQVIPNGAQVGVFRPLPESVEQLRSGLGVRGDHVLITVGNVTERKGQEVVIRALPLVQREMPDTHYLVVGLPTDRARLDSLARELGVGDCVHFVGRAPADDLVRYLNASDVFVMTSRTTATGDCEGYGIAVVEAALCGKPAVVSGESGLREAIEDGVTGLAVPEDDPQATAQAILALLTDEERRRRMGEAALHRALAEQTWEHRVEEYHRLLSSVAASPGASLVST